MSLWARFVSTDDETGTCLWTRPRSSGDSFCNASAQKSLLSVEAVKDVGTVDIGTGAGGGGGVS